MDGNIRPTYEQVRNFHGFGEVSVYLSIERGSIVPCPMIPPKIGFLPPPLFLSSFGTALPARTSAGLTTPPLFPSTANS